MQAISVIHGAVPTLVAAAGNRDFLHVLNNSDTTLYFSYDSDVATALSTLTVNNGFPIAPGGVLVLSNDGHRNIYNRPVYCVHGDAANDKEVRVQGA